MCVVITATGQRYDSCYTAALITTRTRCMGTEAAHFVGLGCNTTRRDAPCLFFWSMFCVCVFFLCNLQGITTAALALSTLLSIPYQTFVPGAGRRIWSVCFSICTRLQFFVEFVTRINPTPHIIRTVWWESYPACCVGVVAVHRNFGQMSERAMCSTNLSR